MKKTVLFILAIVLCATASAEGIIMTASNYPMYSTACEIVGEFGNVIYEPVDGEATLTIGETVISAQDCAVSYIEGDNDVFTIPVNVMIFASMLGDALAKQDPENNDVYQNKLNALIEEYSDMDIEIRDIVSSDTVISCSDGSMAYFAEEYGVQLSDEGGIELRTFNTPSEEESTTAYCVLMRENIEALKK